MPEGGQGLGSMLGRVEQRHGSATDARHDIQEFPMSERAGDEGFFRCTLMQGGNLSEPRFELETEPLVQLCRREGEEGYRRRSL